MDSKFYEKPSIDDIMHYGMPKRSGRYPWGSGEEPYQHSTDFLARYEKLKNSGKSETEIARLMGFVDKNTNKTQTTKLRTQVSLAKDERRAIDIATVKGLQKKGFNVSEIGRQMGKPESTIRSLLNEQAEARMNVAKNTAEFLKKQVDKKGMIDVGTGVERELGVSKEKLKQALYILEMEGYNTYGGGVPQVTNKGQQTNIKVLCPPGTEHKEIFDYEKIHSLSDYVSHDEGQTFDKKYVYPKSMDGKRVLIRYAEEGGIAKDGTVELRRNVPDLDLGESHYAQVRILVNDTHYIKGMALYGDDKNFPPGVDVIFNTNKTLGTPMCGPKDNTVLKNIKKDNPENPFGSLIKPGINDPDNESDKGGGQSYYYDKDGKKQLSLINKRSEEGDWTVWKDGLPAQFLSKQPMQLIKKQLGLSIADKKAEFQEIMDLENPTVKKALLQTFSEDCDSAAVHLRAASLPRQKYKVILPVTSLSDKEVYAPTFKDGEKLALVRYPHGGTFEIPIVTVNNKNAQAKRMLGNAIDAIGINSKVAERLSGADFDGDTVMCIPTHNGKVKIKNTDALKGLKDFDPKIEYPYRPGMKIMKDTQKEMGVISNLITDMTIKGADTSELARAVRHSMVVIDAEKHRLDYKRSYEENGIASLKKSYQGEIGENGRYHEGAATLISRAKSEQAVLKRKGNPNIDPKTGELSYEKVFTDKQKTHVVHETYIDPKTGKEMERMQKSTRMAETNDARTLISQFNAPEERAYAEYANAMKALANTARKERLSTGEIKYNKDAHDKYKKEADSLDHKLNISLKNAPKERLAQTMANAEISALKKSNPDMTKKEIKKASQQALNKARAKVGAERVPVDITDKEWEAIQSGAISPTKLSKIINHTDGTRLRQLATPRTVKGMSQAQIAQIAAMNASGYTIAQIAERLGKSASTISKYLK